MKIEFTEGTGARCSEIKFNYSVGKSDTFILLSWPMGNYFEVRPKDNFDEVMIKARSWIELEEKCLDLFNEIEEECAIPFEVEDGKNYVY